MGAFDDLIPQQEASPVGGAFADLIPADVQGRDGALAYGVDQMQKNWYQGVATDAEAIDAQLMQNAADDIAVFDQIDAGANWADITTQFDPRTGAKVPDTIRRYFGASPEDRAAMRADQLVQAQPSTGLLADVARFGNEHAAAQDQDIAEGGYQPDYQGGLLDQSLGDIPGFMLEKTLENAPSMGVTVAGGVASQLLGGPLATAIRAANVGQNVTQLTGETANEMKDKGVYDPRTALKYGVPAGALDYLVDTSLFKGAFSPKNLLAASGKTLPQQIAERAAIGAKGTATGGVKEGTTELAQGELQRAAVTEQGGSYTPEELANIRATEFALGAIMGGPVQGIGDAIQPTREKAVAKLLSQDIEDTRIPATADREAVNRLRPEGEPIISEPTGAFDDLIPQLDTEPTGPYAPQPGAMPQQDGTAFDIPQQPQQAPEPVPAEPTPMGRQVIPASEVEGRVVSRGDTLAAISSLETQLAEGVDAEGNLLSDVHRREIESSLARAKTKLEPIPRATQPEPKAAIPYSDTEPFTPEQVETVRKAVQDFAAMYPDMDLNAADDADPIGYVERVAEALGLERGSYRKHVLRKSILNVLPKKGAELAAQADPAPVPAEPQYTDPARAQELQNSIREAELMLSEGVDATGKKLTSAKRAGMQKSLESSQRKLRDLVYTAKADAPADAPRIPEAGSKFVHEGAKDRDTAIKSYISASVDSLLAQHAKGAAPGSKHITIDVPGGPKYTVVNTPERLEEFRNTYAKTNPPARKGAPKNPVPASSKDSALKSFLDDGELDNAYHYAQNTGKSVVFGRSNSGESIPYFGEPLPVKKAAGVDGLYVGQTREKGENLWRVMDPGSGLSVATGSSKKAALDEYADLVKKVGVDKVKARIAEMAKPGTQDELRAQFLNEQNIERDTPAEPAKTAEPAPAKKSEAPEHRNVQPGVTEEELKQIVKEFNEAQETEIHGEGGVTNVFKAPAKGERVRLNDKVKVYREGKGWMTVKEAKAEIAKWKANARKQGQTGKTAADNSQRVVLSLFDLSGKWSQPWEEAGYQVYRFDIQDNPEIGDVNNFSVEFFNENFGDFDGAEIYAVLAACPCTDFAVSGAKHFAAKDADGRTVSSVKLVHQTLATIEYFKPAVWAVENPVGRIEKLGGLPPWRLSFDPNHLGDPYTKKTLIWGRFNGNLPIAPVDPVEGSKMHKKYGGKSLATKNARSETPEGFAYGFFQANNAVDNPVIPIAYKYDRLDRGLIERAVAAGVTEKDISAAIDDYYYMDMDDESAEDAIRELMGEEAASGDEDNAADYMDSGDNFDSGEEFGPSFSDVSRTDRPSYYDTLWHDIGMSSAEAKAATPLRQYKAISKALKDKYGFEVVERKGLDIRRASDSLLDAYRNLHFMAHSLGLPLNAMSLNGQIRLVLEKDNKAYLGAWSNSTKTLKMPGRSNSFAHEWGHALDFLLLERITEEKFAGLSAKVRKEGLDFEATSEEEAFVDLMNALFFDDAETAAQILKLEHQSENSQSEAVREKAKRQLAELRKGSSKIRKTKSTYYQTSGQNGNGNYFRKPTEMLARAIEAYVARKVDLVGGGNEFITKGDAAYLSNADARLATTFPKEHERDRIFLAFDKLFDKIRETEALGEGAADLPPAHLGVNDPNVWVKYGADPDSAQNAKNIKQWLWRDIRETVDQFKHDRQLEKVDRPKNPKGFSERATDWAGTFLMGVKGYASTIENRYAKRGNVEAARRIQALKDKLMRAPGEGRKTDDFETEVEYRLSRFVMELDKVGQKHKIKKWSRAKLQQLRDVMTAHEKVDAPADVMAAAEEYRRLMDKIWYYANNAGLKLGYVEKQNYLPRMMNRSAVMADAKGFQKRAKLVYDVVFRDETGIDLDAEDFSNLKPEAFFEEYLPHVYARRGKDTPDSVKDLYKLYNEYTAAEDDKVKEQLRQDLIKALEDDATLVEEVRDENSQFSAQAWYSRQAIGEPFEFTTRGPDSNFKKQRTLPPEADAILRDYYVNDPLEAMVSYMTNVARRTEYARRFGDDSAKLNKELEGLLKAGVNVSDIETLRDMVEVITGRNRSALPPAATRFFSNIQFLGTVSLLTRATFASLTEPVSISFQTGNIFDAAKAIGHQAAWVTRLKGKERRVALRRLSEYTGVIQSSAGRSIMLSRIGGSFAEDVRYGKRLDNFFRNTLLTPLTDVQRMISAEMGMKYLGHLMEDATGNGKYKDYAIKELAEYGIEESDIKSIQKWHTDAVKEGNGIPSIESMMTKEGDKFGRAMLVFADYTIQNPQVSDRPYMASTPWGRLVYGIMSFGYAFWNNATKRGYKRIQNNDGIKGQLWLQYTLATGGLIAGQTVAAIVRDAIFNPSKYEDDEPAEKASKMILTGLERSNLAGPVASTLMSIYSGLRYERDITTITAGAYPGYFLQGTQKVMSGFRNNSPKTNTGEHNMVQGIYQLVGVPLMGYGLSMVPGGTMTGAVLGAATMWGQSYGASEKFADLMVGEKGTKTRKEVKTKQAGLPKLPKLGDH